MNPLIHPSQAKTVFISQVFYAFFSLMSCLFLPRAYADIQAVRPGEATGNYNSAARAPSPRLDLKPVDNSEKLSSTGFDQKTLAEPTGILILPQVLMLTLTQNPELSAFSTEIRAREAAMLQASLLPNPTFSANASNFGNTIFQGFDGDSVTLQLSQLIELGGKRAARTKAAELNQQLANWDYESKRIDVLTQATQAFIKVLFTQERLTLLKELQKLAAQVANAASTQVKAGSVTPLEETRANVALASSNIEMMRAQRALEAARRQLSSFWNSTQPMFEEVAGNLEKISAPPALESLHQQLKNNPDLARWIDEISQRQAVITVEKSKAIPDLTLTLGGNKYLQGGDYNLLAGFSIPIPVFDRNQGSIQEAEQRLGIAKNQSHSARVRLMTRLNTRYQQLQTAFSEITALRDNVIPGAESAYDAASRGYRLGKFGFLTVLDAQRTLFGVKAQYLQALAEFHLSIAEIERLIGGDFQTHSEQASK